jgi:hypothetical protein
VTLPGVRHDAEIAGVAASMLRSSPAAGPPRQEGQRRVGPILRRFVLAALFVAPLLTFNLTAGGRVHVRHALRQGLPCAQCARTGD